MRGYRSLDGKVAVVTGATKGIGRAVAVVFARAGSRVVASGRTRSLLDEVAREVEREGGTAVAVPGDIAREADVRALIGTAMERFGGIDILVNNAGQIIRTSLEETSVDAWDGLMDVNLRGVFLCTRAAVEVMRKRGEGKIINISSTAGNRGFPNRTAYCASKFAVTGLSASLAQELARDNISVSAISPGIVDTEMGRGSQHALDPSRWLRAEDIAELALFLATRPPNVLIPDVTILARDADYFRQ
jgi:NAD(P)-dependent dehydrogenase (short-subunit alcohol dehydrogenase family)